MIYQITASADTTLYNFSNYPSQLDRLEQNTGLDEILELKKDIRLSNNIDYSRVLIKFNLNHISSSIVAGSSKTFAYSLKLEECQAEEIPMDFTVDIHAVSQSWDMGKGRYNDTPVTTVGASWKYKDSKETATVWNPSSASFTANTTGSGAYGGNWFLSPSQSVDFKYKSKNINANVTNIVNNWLDGTWTNNGFMIKLDETYETNSDELGYLKFFSKESSTIYVPRLLVKWDDSVWVTGSLTELTDENLFVYIKNVRTAYYIGDKIKFRVIGRKAYETYTYNTSFTASGVTEYLPTSSYYEIYDAQTNQSIIGPDTSYTKLSCDASGNYFNLWTDQLEPERYYGIKIKMVNANGTIYYKDNCLFKMLDN